MNTALHRKASTMPAQSGVYLMKNDRGKIIYVGKAKNLRNRLRTYFVATIENLKIRALVKEIRDFEIILTTDEVEALLLERTLIKHQKPRYNVLLRDDKEFPWLRVDLQEQWPRLEKVRQKQDDGAVYFGPYGSVKSLNLLLNLVRRIFPLVRCSRYQFKHATRPCNYYQMKMCLAPCHFDIPRVDYLHMMEQAMNVLRGNTQAVAASLNQAMHKAAQEEKFELAARCRDQLQALQNSTQRRTVVLSSSIDADVFGIDIYKGKALLYVLTVRDGCMLGHDYFCVTSLLENAQQVLTEFLLQYYEHRQLPADIFLPFAVEQVLFTALEARNCNITVGTTASNDAGRLLALASKNAVFQLRQGGRDYEAELRAVQKLLKLKQLPRRIECLDISNFQHSAIVAALVCFIDGKPHSDLYRKYKLAETATKPDDYSSIAEVVQRRLQRLAKDNDHFDLLLIDGGKGQLQAAQKVCTAMGYPDIALAALAKNRKKHTAARTLSRGERVFIPHRSTSLPLPPSAAAFKILTRLRDEAHRCARAYHRRLRDKISKASPLCDVPGVGKVLHQRLLQKFPARAALQQASIEQLLEIKGMTRPVAQAVLDFFSTAEHS